MMLRQIIHRSALLLCAALCTDAAIAQATDSQAITFNITIDYPEPSCTLTGDTNLSFGTHQRQASGSDSESGEGRATLTGSDVSEYEVTLGSLPSSFPDVDVDLSLSWSESSDGSNYATVSGNSYSGTAGGVWTTLTHYFRVSGTASWNWADITTSGSDLTSIDISASCTRTG